MKAYKFRHLIWQFNALIDTGEYDDIHNDEVHRHAAKGTIPSFLADRFGDKIDVSILEPQDWTELSEEWQRFENAIDERRKMGLENRGLCLLLGYALQSLQDRNQE